MARIYRGPFTETLIRSSSHDLIYAFSGDDPVTGRGGVNGIDGGAVRIGCSATGLLTPLMVR